VGALRPNRTRHAGDRLRWPYNAIQVVNNARPKRMGGLLGHATTPVPVQSGVLKALLHLAFLATACVQTQFRIDSKAHDVVVVIHHVSSHHPNLLVRHHFMLSQAKVIAFQETWLQNQQTNQARCNKLSI
ncbi:hypothetical protein VaNZ11_014737, partial [Volvox africanus]